MAKWWTSALAVTFAVAGVALGQDPYLPVGQSKPEVMPEPIPCFGSPAAPTMPTPPAAAPDTPNSLPAGTINAWCDEFCAPPMVYFQLGYFALMRQDPGFRT